MIEIEPYTPGRREEWNAFVAGSKNGTFLFHRDYMDYHSDRFADASLMVRGRGGRVVALLPANRSGEQVVSHAGLTFGGFVTDGGMTLPVMVEIFGETVEHLRAQGVETLRYKSIPSIYHSQPSDEDLYCLFLHGAALYRRDVLVTLLSSGRLPVQERRRRSLQRAARAGLTVREDRDFAAFWQILFANLQQRFGVAPVHSLEEIQRLAAAFPEQIRLFAAYRDGEMLAGAVVYVSRTVCHVQYNAASEEGRRLGALDLVLECVIREHQGTPYVDFGASTERDGHFLNVGLVDYKEGFGARTVVHDFYELSLTSNG